MHPNRPWALVLACKEPEFNHGRNGVDHDHPTCFERAARSTRGAMLRRQLHAPVDQKRYTIQADLAWRLRLLGQLAKP